MGPPLAGLRTPDDVACLDGSANLHVVSLLSLCERRQPLAGERVDLDDDLDRLDRVGDVEMLDLLDGLGQRDVDRLTWPP